MIFRAGAFTLAINYCKCIQYSPKRDLLQERGREAGVRSDNRTNCRAQVARLSLLLLNSVYCAANCSVMNIKMSCDFDHGVGTGQVSSRHRFAVRLEAAAVLM